MPAATPDVILASASPRRRELLERLGLRVDARPADVDETPNAAEPIAAYVRRLAREKCGAIAKSLAPGEATTPVLAADTTVCLDDKILGKPIDADDAAKMLRSLAGRRHEVITAYQIRAGDKVIERSITTAVTFRLIAPAEIEAYIQSGEWLGKAGGYAIQGIAAVFASDVRGSWTNVVGLPLCEVVADLRAAGGLGNYPSPGFGITT